MSKYKLENFVRTAKPTDNLVTIYNSDGDPAYTINPLSITRNLVQNNLIKLTTNKNILINLDFSDNREARLSLVELQKQFDIIKGRITKEAEEKTKAVEIVQIGTDFTQLYDQMVSGTQSGTQSGGTQSGNQSGTQSGTTIDARIINLVWNISQDMKKARDWSDKIDRGPDFIQLYEDKKTSYDSNSATYSSDDSITEKVSSLVQYIAQDFYKSINKKQERIIESYTPVGIFTEDKFYPQNILDTIFNRESEGIVSIKINGIDLKLGTSTQSVVFFSDDNLETATDIINNGSVLYINTGLLGYHLDDSDIISVEYLSRYFIEGIPTSFGMSPPRT